MPDAAVPAGFEDVKEAAEVAGGVGPRIFDRVAHAGLRGEVDHGGEAVAAEQGIDAVGIGEVEFGEAEAVAPQPFEPRHLECGVVVAVEVVEADHLGPFVEQA